MAGPENRNCALRCLTASCTNQQGVHFQTFWREFSSCRGADGYGLTVAQNKKWWHLLAAVAFSFFLFKASEAVKTEANRVAGPLDTGGPHLLLSLSTCNGPKKGLEGWKKEGICMVGLGCNGPNPPLRSPSTPAGNNFDQRKVTKTAK